jgi:peptidoglycan hydrolase-like protein with peptidoglycan-binding domain
MKYLATAALAVTMAAALAGTAGAQGMATGGPTPSSWRDAVPGIGPMTATENIRKSQEQLRTLGLYSGPIDGRLNQGTRAALTAFQERYGLPRTGTLDQTTFAWLANSNAPVGYGSSTPPAINRPLTSPDNPQAVLGAGGITTGGQYFSR